MDNKWISLAEAAIMQELMNAEHNDWVRKNGHCGGDPDCVICNSMLKPTRIVYSNTDNRKKDEYTYKHKGKEYTEQEFKNLVIGGEYTIKV